LAIMSALALETPPPPVALNLEVPAEQSDLFIRLVAKKPKHRPPSPQPGAAKRGRIGDEARRRPGRAPPGARAPTEPLQAQRTQLLEPTSKLLEPTSKRQRPRWLWSLIGGGVGVAALVVLLVLLASGGGSDGDKPTGGDGDKSQPGKTGGDGSRDREI